MAPINRDREGVPAVHDTVKMRDGESRDAFRSNDFFDFPGIVVGYKDASKAELDGGRPLLMVRCVDYAETSVLETLVEVVSYNEHILNPNDVSDELNRLRVEHGLA